MLHLFIELGNKNPAILVHVHEEMFVETLVARLVAQLDYPQVSNVGPPLRYTLRQVSAAQPLPPTQRFAEIRLVSGTHLILEATTDRPTETPFWRVPSHRRQFIRASSVIAICSLFGLSAGFGTSILQASTRSGTPVQAQFTRTSPAHPPVTSTLPTPPCYVQPPPSLRTATPLLTFGGHQQDVLTVAWHPQGTQLASGSADTTLQVWNPDGSVQQRLSHAAPVRALAWSPTGDRLASGAATQLTFFNAFSGAVLAQASKHTATITSLAWAKQGNQQLVSAANDTLALIWNTTMYHLQNVFARHTTPIEAVSWAPDGSTVASSSEGGAIRSWTANTQQEIHPYHQDARVPMRALAFAPHDFRLAGGGDDGLIRLYQAQQCSSTGSGIDGETCLDAPQRFSLSTQPILALAWSPDGAYLATGHQDGMVAIWHGQTHHLLFSFVVEFQAPVQSVSWSPAGNILAVAVGRLVMLWGLQS